MLSSGHSISPERADRPSYLLSALAVVTFFPWPLDHGDALRRYMILEGLASATSLTAICVTRPTTTQQDIEQLRLRLPSTRLIVVPLWQREHGTWSSRVRRIVKGLLTTTPPWVYRQHGKGLADEVNQLCRRSDVDLAVLVGEPAGLCASRIRARHTVLDKSNVVTASEIDAVRTIASPVGKLRAAAGIPLTYLFERRVIPHVDQVVVTSNEEAGRLERYFGAVRTAVIPSAVSIPDQLPVLDHESQLLLWLSTISYLPNWDGLLRFLNANHRFLDRAGWRVRVVGAGASRGQVQTLQAFSCVDYVGYAVDLVTACAGVSVGVIPVWSGAGVKLKTLTMMSLGIPVVATPVAMEGIPHEAAARVVTTPEDFACAIAGLDPRSLAEAASRGRSMIQGRFSDRAFFDAVRDVVNDVAAR